MVHRDPPGEHERWWTRQRRLGQEGKRTRPRIRSRQASVATVSYLPVWRRRISLASWSQDCRHCPRGSSVFSSAIRSHSSNRRAADPGSLRSGGTRNGGSTGAPGNPSKRKTLSLPEPAIRSYLDHGITSGGAAERNPAVSLLERVSGRDERPPSTRDACASTHLTGTA